MDETLLFVCACVVWAAGVALAVILSGVRHISDTVFLEAAKVGLRTECFLFLHLCSCHFFKR